MEQILTLSFAIFLLMDPIGNIPLYVSLLKEISPERQKKIILRELLIALVVIICFYFLGDFFLDALGIKDETILIAGGIVLFLIAIKMVFPSKDTPHEDKIEDEPFIVPLAIPLVAGPAVLAAVMIYSHRGFGHLTVVSAIIIAWIAATLVLVFSAHLKNVLKQRGIIACERLMGLILTLIAIQMFLDGLHVFLHTKL